jgi:16S rRNA G966 N2-methylase RsmD
LPEFAGKVNLIYIDPPFDTGADFSFTAAIPDHEEDGDESVVFTKEPSIIEQKAYRDTWGGGLILVNSAKAVLPNAQPADSVQ